MIVLVYLSRQLDFRTGYVSFPLIVAKHHFIVCFEKHCADDQIPQPMTKFRIQKMRLAKQFHSNNLLVFATAIIFIIYTNKYNSIM